MTFEPARGVRAGIDLGGTGTRFVILSEGRELAAQTVPTAWFNAIDAKERTASLARMITRMVPQGHTLVSLGIGASGPVNTRTGVIDNSDTLACFSHFPIVEEMARHLAIPVCIDNDAVCAAVGEYALGAGQGCGRLMVVTLGTGIGVSLLIDGKPFRLANGDHPEAGHIPIADGPDRCYCGLRGCWESLASRTWLQQSLQRALPDKPYEKQDLAFYREQREQNPAVAAVFDRYGDHLGRGLNSLLALYGPEITLLSGSAAVFYPLYQDAVAQSLERAAGFAVNKHIRQSALGDAAGALGAALLPGCAL